MAFKSDKQRKFFNSPTGKAKIGAEKVEEFNEASKGMQLPEKVTSAPPLPNPNKHGFAMNGKHTVV